MGLIAGRFGRVESRQLARDAVLGLMSPLAVKNCWTLAEHAGHDSPDRLQHLLRKASWDTDGVRDDLRGYVVDRLGGPGDRDAMLIVDETGDLKKGDQTVGVQRQYTGTAGRIENAQVAVYLTYATSLGHALIDRDLYLPQSWTDDQGHHCRERAGVPEDVEFATKPMLAAEMITRALDAGVSAAWVAADEVYGGDPGLRRRLEGRAIGYVLAIACSHPVHAGRAGSVAVVLLVLCGQGRLVQPLVQMHWHWLNQTAVPGVLTLEWLDLLQPESEKEPIVKHRSRAARATHHRQRSLPWCAVLAGSCPAVTTVARRLRKVSGVIGSR